MQKPPQPQQAVTIKQVYMMASGRLPSGWVELCWEQQHAAVKASEYPCEYPQCFVHIINALHRLKWRKVITCLLCGSSGGCIKEECRVSPIYDVSETGSRFCLSDRNPAFLRSAWSSADHDLWILGTFDFIFNFSAWLWCYFEKDAFGFTPG